MGSFGKVYKAIKDNKDKETFYAIKTIDKNQVIKDHMQAYIQAEINSME